MILCNIMVFFFSFEVIKLDHWSINDSSFGPLIAGLHNDIYHMGYFPSILTIERLNYANVITQVWPARYYSNRLYFLYIHIFFKSSYENIH